MNRITAGDARLVEQVSDLSSRGYECWYVISRNGDVGSVVVRPEPDNSLIRRLAEITVKAHLLTEEIHRCQSMN